MTDIGRAGMVMKGDYNSASTYETLDAVTYNNALYIAKQNVPAGIVPTNTTYWQSAIDADNIINSYKVFRAEKTYERNVLASSYDSFIATKNELDIPLTARVVFASAHLDYFDSSSSANPGLVLGYSILPDNNVIVSGYNSTNTDRYYPIKVEVLYTIL